MLGIFHTIKIILDVFRKIFANAGLKSLLIQSDVIGEVS